MKPLEYYPPPTIERFMLSDSLVRVLVGPLGSGKSMGCIVELVRRSRQQAPDSEGVRRTRFAIIRNTLQQLRATVLEDIKLYLSPMIRYFVTDSTVQIRAPLDDGTTVVSDWMLIPLDTKEDVRRLLSLQLTGAWINECREVPFDIILPLLGRCGRYPSKVNGGVTWRGIIADTNPWDTDSDYHDALVLNPKPRWELFHQPSGIGPDAENRANLDEDYYERIMGGKDPGWQEVHVESQWGESNAGQAVFRRSFHAQTHVKDIVGAVNPHRPIMVCQDFGRTPTALITQVDNYGRLIVYQEVTTDGKGLHSMLAEDLKPILLGPVYGGRRVFMVADPAGREKSQHTEDSAFDVIRDHGILVYPAPTNNIAPRLLAVEKLFNQTLMGQPAVQISRSGCPQLIKALGSKYRYRKKRDGVLEDLPEKLHPWSDVADCLQYGALAVNANLTGRVVARDQARNVTRTPITAGGWT